eukprot:TRINITY_DN1466_c0_g1_i1.p1 TRINITY_DN1466_c0_g1~~TRINITY_DN1466_c0_g1_i1.p1  ORF type:complete len:597 (-),score=133.34 TRINITY_DN1466_c0_g1_i1:227-1993(-)
MTSQSTSSSSSNDSKVVKYWTDQEDRTFQRLRTAFGPQLPTGLRDFLKLKPRISDENPYKDHDDALKMTLKNVFPQTYGQPMIAFEEGIDMGIDEVAKRQKAAASRILKVGCVLSGGQAPGGHSVIVSIFDALQKLNPKNEILGFREGPSGLLKNRYIRLTKGIIDKYRNTGGFDMIGSGRTKISTQEHFAAAKLTADAHDLDALVIIGGDDSNTNAAHMAEYFRKFKAKCVVVGVPKTIDGDLANDFVEISFGFDTACKIYANEIANLQRDARSARKYWFFIKMMGRSASHITLECAMQTHPNMALISEEVAAKKKTLHQIVSEIADVVCERAKLNKNYGVILIPEGLVEFIPEIQRLMIALNRLLAHKLHALVLKALKKPESKVEYISSELQGEQRTVYESLPLEIQMQLILDRDSHGNVAVSQIETEKLLGQMVKVEIDKRKKAKSFFGSFDWRTFFCGYEGRSGYPSNFDTKYCYALGHLAVALTINELSGYMCCVSNLHAPVEQWRCRGLPITSMMCLEERHARPEPVIKKMLVDLTSKKFLAFAVAREGWALQDAYIYTGPIQYWGPKELTELTNFHLRSLM